MTERYKQKQEQSDQNSQETKTEETRTKEPMRHETFELHGTRIEFFGIKHTTPFLNQHRETLTNAIRNAAIVFLEGAPHTEGIFSEETIKELQSFFSRKGYQPSRESIERFILEKKQGFAFYAALENIAAQYGKPIATADPAAAMGDAFKKIIIGKTFEDIDDDTERARTALIVGGILLAALPSCGNNLKECLKNLMPKTLDAEKNVKAEQKSEQLPREQKPKGKMSRRNFLRVLGGGIAAPALLSETASALFEKNMEPPGYRRHIRRRASRINPPLRRVAERAGAQAGRVSPVPHRCTSET
ncbi:MAG: hypothetical protein UX06_C0032G0010 [Candidatus Giovannonibacteria bacterium GW2011_GWA2_45_21]|uniref:Uncharacterized protein n=1 Tax=Candidatus Giovannonibacteria bacterium GW2011_GWA2_45_21 TaxID=1618649 RepID=A0A0G1Q5E4_9BACT|nr:MAG: hypothetical protein UX06_C0032G0010 [Candidatus Giovannonibacteria bacterium GW2011_GWA2_45_21]